MVKLNFIYYLFHNLLSLVVPIYTYSYISVNKIWLNCSIMEVNDSLFHFMMKCKNSYNIENKEPTLISQTCECLFISSRWMHALISARNVLPFGKKFSKKYYICSIENPFSCYSISDFKLVAMCWSFFFASAILERVQKSDTVQKWELTW